VEVGQQRDRYAEVLAEGPVAEGAVDRDADHGHAAALELAQGLLVGAQLVGADRAEVTGVEGEQHAATAEARQRDLLAVVVDEGEVGSRRAGFDHRRRPSCWISAR
jgi:hypothetical protein